MRQRGHNTSRLALLQNECIGFVCRAKFITGSVAQLAAKPGGGSAWLLGLRNVPYPEAAAALCTLPGIGPKVWRLHWEHCQCVPEMRRLGLSAPGAVLMRAGVLATELFHCACVETQLDWS